MTREEAEQTQAEFVALRAAAYTGDGDAARRGLTPAGAIETPQYTGDAVLLALRQSEASALPIAAAVVDALDARGAEGDAELAQELEAALGRRADSGLKPVPADLDELAGQLEGDPQYTGGAIDLRTGDVYPESYFEDRAAWEDSPDDDGDAEDEADGDRWLHIVSMGSRAGYEDMVAYRESLEDARLGELLDVALAGRGAFRRFRDVLASVPGELDRWRRYADERARGRARAWLASEGYRPAVPDRRPRA